MSLKRVLIPQDIAEIGKEYLRKNGYEVVMGSGTSIEQLKNDVKDCDAILARTTKYPAEVLEAGKKLKVIGRHGVGVDNIDIEKATELGIQVTYARDANANTVAEHVLGLILAISKNITLFNNAIRKGDFEIRNKMLGADLEGKTIGILGMGKIGALVAQKAHFGFSMNVLGYDPFLKDEDYPKWVTRIDRWDDIFKISDFISVHIPSNNKTNGSIGEKEFEMMKPSSFFINAARGEVVNEDDLISALQNNSIRGAGLDVFEDEPPALNNPFFRLQNTVLTPHSAALTSECMERMALHAAQGIHEVLSGQKPTWPVNKL